MKKFVYANTNITFEEFTINKFEVGIVNDIIDDKYYIQFASNAGKVAVVSENEISFFTPAKTGDQFDKKVCNVCNRLLDVQLFEKNQNGKNNRTVRRPSCINCRYIINGMDMSADEKREMDKTKPHMVIWTCPICKKTTIPGLTSKVVCDHNHKTGHPRAWICDSCNTGLGRFKDDIELLESAIEYLKSN